MLKKRQTTEWENTFSQFVAENLDQPRPQPHPATFAWTPGVGSSGIQA